MKDFLLAFLLLSCAASPAATSRPVSYQSGDETIQAILFTPKGKGPFPALVVIHEWWGLNDWVKEQASRLADEGYVALAVDLYRGQTAVTASDAQKLAQDLPDERAFRDLHAALEFLKSQPEVKPDRIGSIGWCMGGGYALDQAVQEPTLAAVVVSYGDLTDDPDDLRKIHAPLLGIFGGQDRNIHLSDVRKFQQQLKDLGKNADIQIYPDAGHAFENPNNTTGYRKDDTADAWKRTLAFLNNALKK
ncbi:MAG TPA: dienelactone hydrolase family protein [Terriglobales bacterium]